MIKARPILESDFMRSVTDLATRQGWQWVHWLPGQHRDSWRTTYRGSLGKGFPDLLMLREHDGRCIVMELKRDGQKPTPDQSRVMGVFEACDIAAYCFTPADWDEIEEVLR